MPPTTISRWHGAGGGYSRFDTPFARRAAGMLGRAARKYVNAKVRKWADGTTKKGRPIGSKNKAPRRYAGGGGARRGIGAYKGYTSTYMGKMAVASSADLNKIKRVRGQGRPRGKIVVNRKRGKLLRQQKRKFNESTFATYFIGSNVNMDENNNIGKLDRRFTKPSIDEWHATGYIFNVGAVPLHWNPQTYGKIGNQILEPNPPPGTGTFGPNPMYLINGTNTALEQHDVMFKQSKLPETATPFNTGDIPVSTFFTTPNTILSLVQLNLSFTSASLSDQLLTVQVVRSVNGPTVPGYFSTEGDNSISNSDMIKHLCNHRKNASGKQLEILYTYTTVLKGLNPNAKSPKVHYVKKNVKMNYARSTCRRVSSATQGDTLGGQWKPHFEIDETGAQFNNVFVRAMATCLDNNVYQVKTVPGMPGNVDPGSMGAAKYWINTTQSFDMDTMRDKSQTTMVNARFRYGGTIGVKHYCKETSRGFGSATTAVFSELQDQINDLTSLVSTMQGEIDDAHDEIDEHLGDEDPHTEAGDHNHVPNMDDDHTHPGWTDDIGEHQHATPGDPTTDTPVHSHSEVNIP